MFRSIKYYFLGLGWMLLSAQELKAAVGQLYLKDKCSETYTAVLTPCGSELSFEFFDLDPEKKLDLIIEISPVHHQGKPFRSYKKRYGTMGEKSWTYNREFTLADEYGNEPNFDSTGRIWKIVGRWSQGDLIEEKGQVQTVVFVPPPRVKTFFGVQDISKDTKICNWRSKVEILSGYLYNKENYDFEVSQEVVLNKQVLSAGLQTGAKLPVGSQWTPLNGPLFVNSTIGPIWFLPQMEKIFPETQGVSLKVNKLLPQNQGGFFTRRTIYNRFNSKRMQLVDKSSFFSSHYEWTLTGEGLLDVPETVYEFAFVPPLEAQSIQRAQEFLDLTLSPIGDTCGESGLRSGADFYKVPDHSGTPLFYYPNP
jgi:hypothetical protein